MSPLSIPGNGKSLVVADRVSARTRKRAGPGDPGLIDRAGGGGACLFVTDWARSPGSGNPPTGLPRYNPLWTQDAHVADLGRRVPGPLVQVDGLEPLGQATWHGPNPSNPIPQLSASFSLHLQGGYSDRYA